MLVREVKQDVAKDNPRCSHTCVGGIFANPILCHLDALVDARFALTNGNCKAAVIDMG